MSRSVRKWIPFKVFAHWANLECVRQTDFRPPPSPLPQSAVSVSLLCHSTCHVFTNQTFGRGHKIEKMHGLPVQKSIVKTFESLYYSISCTTFATGPCRRRGGQFGRMKSLRLCVH
jgi:hypothetical protein